MVTWYYLCGREHIISRAPRRRGLAADGASRMLEPLPRLFPKETRLRVGWGRLRHVGSQQLVGSHVRPIGSVACLVVFDKLVLDLFVLDWFIRFIIRLIIRLCYLIDYSIDLLDWLFGWFIWLIIHLIYLIDYSTVLFAWFIRLIYLIDLFCWNFYSFRSQSVLPPLNLHLAISLCLSLSSHRSHHRSRSPRDSVNPIDSSGTQSDYPTWNTP